MNGTDIRNYTFDKGAFGYKVEDVKACLNDISEYVISLESQINNYKIEINKLKETSDKTKGFEDNIKEIIVKAQKFSSDVIDEAKSKAKDILEKAERKKADFDSEIAMKTDTLMSDAKQKADKMIADAVYKSENMTKDIHKKLDIETKQLKAIKKEVSEFKAKLLNLYKSHLDIITKMPECNETVEEKEDTSKQALKPELKNESVDEQSTKVVDLATEDKQPNNMNSIVNEEVNDNKEKSLDEKKEKNPTFKITITENKAAQEAKNGFLDQRNSFKSRFGELKFGENKLNDK